MERTKKGDLPVSYDIHLEPIVLSKPLLDQILQQDEGPGDWFKEVE